MAHFYTNFSIPVSTTHQLQTANHALETALWRPRLILGCSGQAVSAIVQSYSDEYADQEHSGRGARAAKLESFDEAGQSWNSSSNPSVLQSLMQLNMFVDENKKVLYDLSLMHGE